MAEAGCLNNEKYNNIDIDDKLISRTIEAGTLHFNNEQIASNEDNSEIDLEGFLILDEGKLIDLHKKSDSVLPTNSNTFSMDITWPKKTLLKTLSIMFVDPSEQSENFFSVQSTNNIKISLGVKRAGVGLPSGALDGIMSDKILFGGQDSGADVTVNVDICKNVPITIIRNSTGMLEGDIQNSPALSQQLDNLSTRQESFNIKDPYNSWTSDAHFPLYNPVSNGVDKLVITINHKIHSNDNDTNFTDGTEITPAPPDQRFKVLAICTFLRMDEF